MNSRGKRLEQMQIETKSGKRRNPDVRIKLIVILSAMVVLIACSLAPTLLLMRHLEEKVDEALNTIRRGNITRLGDFQRRISQDIIPELRVVYNRTCYCLYTAQLSWFQARDFCLFNRGVAHLAEIEDKETNDFLWPILKSFNTPSAIWLGGSDLEKEGDMKWDTSKLPVTQFSPTQWDWEEPSGQYKGIPEHCIDIFHHKTEAFLWNDDDCNSLRCFLCQSPLTAEDQCGC